MVIDIDNDTEFLIRAMAQDEGVSAEKISREALANYLKKFTRGCITTRLCVAAG